MPRDGPFVYQCCLAQARVTEGGTPNIGLPVTQPHLSPGPQSPSHHLALLPGLVPEVAALSQKKSWLRIEMGNSLRFTRMG